jgi:hypothetical protein
MARVVVAGRRLLGFRWGGGRLEGPSLLASADHLHFAL